MSSFIRAKVRIACAGGQGRIAAALLAVLLVACDNEERRSIHVQADSTGTSGPSSETGSIEEPEIALLEAESIAAPDRAPGPAASDPDPVAERRNGSRPGPEASSEGMEASADRAAGAAREQGGRPPPPLLLPAGGVRLPVGTVLVLDLRTPIHTATTLVGDRFAARVTRGVAAGGRVVIPVGALVEGRVSHVGSASEPGRIAFIELEPRKIRLNEDRRLRITAHILDVTGQEVMGSAADGRQASVVTGGMDGMELSEAVRDARATILAGILEGIDSRAIVAGSTDREIIIPIGTPFTLELAAPLDIPAP